jgi:sensor c-di-GMP phosphodiesterase-like protein
VLDSEPYLDPNTSELAIPSERTDVRRRADVSTLIAGGTLARAMTQLRRRWQSERGADAERPLGMHVGRLLLLVLASTFATVALVCANLWIATSQRAHDSAEHASAFVESRLHEIESEMRRVADAAYEDMNWSSCQPALATMLTRASIASTLVRRFVLSADGMDGSCRPEGRGAAPFFPYEPSTRIAITSTGEIQAQVTATLRRDNSGRIVSAVLDPRAFAMDGAQHAPFRDAEQLTLALLSADGRRLAPLGESGANGPMVDVLRATVTSTLRDVIVRAEVDRRVLLRRLIQAGAVAAAVAIVLTLALVAVFWRRVVLRARLFYRIQRGLRKREFEPFVQPILDLRSGRCAGVEVLMRWQHPQRGTLPPSEFIEEAERTGLIAGMSELVMTRAAHRLAPIAIANPDIYFAFNLTPQQLAQPQLLARLSGIFRTDTIPHDRILLEITEREFVDPVAEHSLRALHACGWRVAVDDFGTGHSSLAALEQLAIDRLKIDRAFVSTISEETVNRPVLDAIIQLADRLTLPTIAEGIETQAQLDYLAARGVQFGQGYLIGRPMSIVAFRDWLTRHNKGTPPALTAQAPTVAAADARPDKVAQRLWNAMRIPGGLDVRDRMFHLRTYPQCFVGREAVDWMVQHARISRSDAVQQGRRLLALGLMAHVVDEHDFEDAELFYRLATPTNASLASTSAPLALRARLQAQDGVRICAHTRGLVRHSRCVTGSALVRWIVSTQRVSRPTARLWALQLMREGVIRHVYDDRPFTDDRSLYRVV